MTIDWNDSYKLGDAEIDAQHQHLFELARKVLAAEDIATIQSLSMDLYRHTRVHFEAEEYLMRQHHYLDLETHIESHNRLLARLVELTKDIGKGTMDKAALDALMTDWAMFHIPLDDARFEMSLSLEG